MDTTTSSSIAADTLTTAAGPATEQIEALENEIAEKLKELARLRKAATHEKVADYTFHGWANEEVTLSELFGDKKELILVHNMGKRCSYCTMWADGFVGMTKHMEDRAAFVVASPDAPDVQRAFARDRGWNFRMVSTDGTTFKRDMGFEPTPGMTWPGFSVFEKKDNGEIWHVAKGGFGPGDVYNPVWHFFDHLPTEQEWHPSFQYSK